MAIIKTTGANIDTSKALSKPAFYHNVEKNLNFYATSGWIKQGSMSTTGANDEKQIDYSAYTYPEASNTLLIGRGSSNFDGASESFYPILNVAGYEIHLNRVNLQAFGTSGGTFLNKITLPPPPNARLENEQLISNHDFANGTTGWNIVNGSPITTNSSGITIGNGTGSSNPANTVIWQQFNTVPRRRYRVEVVFADGNTGLGVNLYINNSNVNTYAGGPANTQFIYPSNDRFVHEFTAAEDKASLGLLRYWGHNGSTTIERVTVIPMDEVERTDLVFMEVWAENVATRDVAYPYGNVQYSVNNLNGSNQNYDNQSSSDYEGIVLERVADESYSSFGYWEQQSGSYENKGYGLRWSTATDVEKEQFLGDPRHNLYIEGDELYQIRYRIRTSPGTSTRWKNVDPEANDHFNAGFHGEHVQIQGENNVLTADWHWVNDASSPYNTLLTSNEWNQANVSWYRHYRNRGVFVPHKSFLTAARAISDGTGEIYALPMYLVRRRNTGVYHPAYNPNGSSKRRIPTGYYYNWYETNANLTDIKSTADCFDEGANGDGENGGWGTIAENNIGRPDGFACDALRSGDFVSLMNFAEEPTDLNDIMENWDRVTVSAINADADGMLAKGNTIATTDISGYRVPLYQGNYTSTAYFHYKVSDVPWALTDGKTAKVYNPRTGEIRTAIFWTAINTSHRPPGGVTAANGYGHGRYDDAAQNFGDWLPGDEIIILRSNANDGNWNLDDAHKVLPSTDHYGNLFRQSGLTLQCDIVGDLSQLPSDFRYNVSGTPIVMDMINDTPVGYPDGSNKTYYLSKKARDNTCVLAVYYRPSTGTWTPYTQSIAQATNTAVQNFATNEVALWYYWTYASPMESDIRQNNANVNTSIGEHPRALVSPYYVRGLYHNYSNMGIGTSHIAPGIITRGIGGLGNNMRVRVDRDVTDYRYDYSVLRHASFDWDNIGASTAGSYGYPGVKAAPFLEIDDDGRIYLSYLYQTVHYTSGTWGDDNQINVYLNNHQHYTDSNSRQHRIGYTRRRIPYFIKGNKR